MPPWSRARSASATESREEGRYAGRWVPSDEPVASAQLALERARQQAGLPELPRSGWTLVSDDGSGRRVYASGSWGVEVLQDARGWLAVSAFRCG